jgi:hypothetical protein
MVLASPDGVPNTYFHNDVLTHSKHNTYSSSHYSRQPKGAEQTANAEGILNKLIYLLI